MDTTQQSAAGPVTEAHAQWIIALLGGILLSQIIALLILLAA
jgi:hypothetical protein